MGYIKKKIVNWITPSTAVMECRRCFPQFKMVYIFLKYFSQNTSQMMLPNVHSISEKKQNNWMKNHEQRWWKLPNI